MWSPEICPLFEATAGWVWQFCSTRNENDGTLARLEVDVVMTHRLKHWSSSHDKIESVERSTLRDRGLRVVPTGKRQNSSIREVLTHGFGNLRNQTTAASQQTDVDLAPIYVAPCKRIFKGCDD